MSLPHTILGMLDWKSFTGYELKKRISRTEFLPWSGNSNQVYTSLLELNRSGYVSCEIAHQDDGPTKKIYSITATGRLELKTWLRTKPTAPEIRNLFLAQLSWGDLLDPVELEDLILAYEEAVRGQLLMAKEEIRRNEDWGGDSARDDQGSVGDSARGGARGDTPNRSAREAYIWEMIAENRVNALEAELHWIFMLRQRLPGRSGAEPGLSS